jgi:isopenicillin-N N-acyltransferase-like protein
MISEKEINSKLIFQGLLAMTMFSTDDNLQTNNKNGYLPIDLLRRIFIESPTFSVGIRRITSAPRNSSLNMIVATAEGEGLSIELTPKQFYISYPSIKKDIYTHSNHFKSESFLAKESIRDAIRGGSSFYRDRQLERRLLKSWPNIDENSFENAFKDHLGYPESLCGHKAEEGNECISNLPDYCTVAAVIYNLNRRSIKLCKGHPCKRNFVEYQLLPSLY